MGKCTEATFWRESVYLKPPAELAAEICKYRSRVENPFFFYVPETFIVNTIVNLCNYFKFNLKTLSSLHQSQARSLSFKPKILSAGRLGHTFFLGSILITRSVHTDREKVSTKPLVILIMAINEVIKCKMFA